jgi:hypothetical protein
VTGLTSVRAVANVADGNILRWLRIAAASVYLQLVATTARL